jgi:hypothetical protein
MKTSWHYKLSIENLKGKLFLFLLWYCFPVLCLMVAYTLKPLKGKYVLPFFTEYLIADNETSWLCSTILRYYILLRS